VAGVDRRVGWWYTKCGSEQKTKSSVGYVTAQGKSEEGGGRAADN